MGLVSSKATLVVSRFPNHPTMRYEKRSFRLVPRRKTERLGELYRSACGQESGQSGADLGTRRAGARTEDNLWVSGGGDPGSNPGEGRSFGVFRELKMLVNQAANALRAHGVKKGDCVAIYMSVSPMEVVAMLACARIGAIHNVIFGGFSPEAIASRINDGKCLVWAFLVRSKQLRFGFQLESKL